MEGLASLGISVPTLLAQLVNFSLLFLLLRFVAYKPVMKMLDERSRRIRESMEQTEYIKQQATHAEQDVRKRLEDAGREGQEIVNRAARVGEEMRQKAQQEAHEEAEALINRARAEIQRERDEAISSVRQEFADLTILAASKVIGRSLDRETHRKLIERTLEESIALKKGN